MSRQESQTSSAAASSSAREAKGTAAQGRPPERETLPPRGPKGPTGPPPRRQDETPMKVAPATLSPSRDSTPGHLSDRMAFEYEFRMRIEAPRPTVFERLLRIEHLSRWFCGWSRIEPKVGGSFKFGGETCIIPPEGRSWDTTIDEGEVLRRFAFRWTIRSSESRVSYELEDGPNGMASLAVRHRGVPIRETTCGTVQDAWRMCLGNLKSVAEGRGDSVRPDHAPVTSPDLRLSVLIEAAPAKVFEAFSRPAESLPKRPGSNRALAARFRWAPEVGPIASSNGSPDAGLDSSGPARRGGFSISTSRRRRAARPCT